MKYTYSLGPYSLHADIDESVLQGALPEVVEEARARTMAEVNTAMGTALLDELYREFAKETSAVIVNSEDITISAEGLNTVLATMASRYTTWLQSKGILPEATITENP